eukprot:scaffold5572_cov390-Prasinococcus_capsulatus_cf.AAC.2
MPRRQTSTRIPPTTSRCPQVRQDVVYSPDPATPRSPQLHEYGHGSHVATGPPEEGGGSGFAEQLGTYRLSLGRQAPLDRRLLVQGEVTRNGRDRSVRLLRPLQDRSSAWHCK